MLDPCQFLQAFSGLSAITVKGTHRSFDFSRLILGKLLLINSIPALRSRFIAYGPRAIPTIRAEKHERPEDGDTPNASVTRTFSWFLDTLAALRVPHGYFLHFYIVSVASLGFWMTQLLTKGVAFRFICSIGEPDRLGRSMTTNQIALTWFLMMLQSMRRLFETSFLAKPSTSKMWFVHWLLGMLFYLSMSIAIWIEGAGKIYTVLC